MRDPRDTCGAVAACGRWADHRGQHGGYRPVARVAELASRLETLSPRERQALERIADGLTNPEIAADLGVTVRRVVDLCTGIYAKLGLPADNTRCSARLQAAVAFAVGTLHHPGHGATASVPLVVTRQVQDADTERTA